MSNVFIIGMGPGEDACLTKEAIKALEACPYVVGSARLLSLADSYRIAAPEMHVLKDLQNCLQWIEEKQRLGDVCVLVSGDVHYYSLAGTIARSGYHWKTKLIPGISSYQALAARMGVTLEEAALCSVHGRNESEGYVSYQAYTSPKAFFLCSNTFPPERIGKALCQYGLEQCMLTIGSFLYQEKESVVTVTAKKAATEQYPGFSVVCVENPDAKSITVQNYLKDSQFIRGKVPMTKEEVRILIMHKLEVQPWDCVWDLGAGTGSISIEMARHIPFGEVYSVEYKEAALALIHQNKERFGCKNLSVISGRIQEVLEKLPDPDRVFLGGSEGELETVVDYLAKLPNKVHFVMTAVTMETLSEAVRILSKREGFSYIQVQIGQSKAVGAYHTTQMNHPVWILEVDL